MMRKMRVCIFCIALLTGVSGAYAQKDNQPVGARSAAMGNASVTLVDFWALHNNQAAMAFYEHMAVGIYAENRFLMKELSQGTFGFVLPVKGAGVFGINYNYFGNALYNESKLGLAYALALGKNISGGIQLDYLRTNIGEDYGSNNLFTFEVSLYAKLVENLSLGVHVFNPVHMKLSKTTNERVPAIFRAGLSYSFSDKALVAVETEKDINNKAQIRAGVEYHLVKPVYLRIGIGTNPFSNSFGVGFVFGKVKADISASRHQVLGFSPQISLNYEIK